MSSVILPREAVAAWLSPGVEAREALALLRPFPVELMSAQVASRLVNSVRNEGPDLLVATAAAA